jgi:hypothetical protein
MKVRHGEARMIAEPSGAWGARTDRAAITKAAQPHYSKPIHCRLEGHIPILQRRSTFARMKRK